MITNPRCWIKPLSSLRDFELWWGDLPSHKWLGYFQKMRRCLGGIPSKVKVGGMDVKNQLSIIASLELVAFCVVFFLWPSAAIAESKSQQDWQIAHNFYDALWKGDSTNVFESVKQNPQIVNQPLLSGDKAISVAVDRGHLAIAEFLLTNNADVNSRGRFGQTPLHYAVNNGDNEMVRLLLKYKADINAQDDSHIAPIVYSIKSAEVIKTLLAHGADINTHDSHNSLLSMATGDRQSVGPGVIEFILTNGVDVGKCGEDPILNAFFQNDTNTMRLFVPLYSSSTNPEASGAFHSALAESVDRNMNDMAKTIISVLLQYQTNNLQRAIISNDMAAVQIILSTNLAALDSQDFFGWTPLHVGAITGNKQVEEFLLKNQANVNVQDELGSTPLHWAIFRGDEDSVELLLQNKADINLLGMLSSWSGDCPVDLAIRCGFSSIAIKLLNRGANHEAHVWWGTTALHIATEKGNVEVMKALIAHGASVNVFRGANYRQSPLDIAVCGNSPEAVALLITNGARLETEMGMHDGRKTTLFNLWAERGGDTNIAALLLAAGCDLNATNGDGQTPLHVAIDKWNSLSGPGMTTVRFVNPTNLVPIKWQMEESHGEPSIWFLNHNAEVNAKDTNGQTALHIVVRTANTKAIQALLDHKAEINAKDKNGKTPLEVMEDYKIACYNDRHGFSIPDFKPAEDLLVTNGACGAILAPQQRRAMRGF